MPQRHNGTEKERRREGEKERRREGEIKRRKRAFPPSLRQPVSLSLCLSVSLSICLSVAGQTGPFEKRAISSTQEMPASDLDEALPDRPFAKWFSEITGPKAGVVWQLTECGEQISGPGETGQDLPACAEVNASLSDGRKVFVVIRVGTYKKGLTGKPTLFRAVIEQNERFYQVRRLSDLPEMLRDPEGAPATVAKKRTADLPAIKMDSARIIAPFSRLTPPSSNLPPVTGDPSKVEEPPSAPPPPSEPPPPSAQDLEKVPESVSQSRAITKVKPVYPPTAKKMNATGTVEVEITISEAGLVVEATAISGHLALRSAAVDAARKWVFNPAILNGEPVRVKSVLTFIFAPSAK